MGKGVNSIRVKAGLLAGWSHYLSKVFQLSLSCMVMTELCVMTNYQETSKVISILGPHRRLLAVMRSSTSGDQQAAVPRKNFKCLAATKNVT